MKRFALSTVLMVFLVLIAWAQKPEALPSKLKTVKGKAPTQRSLHLLDRDLAPGAKAGTSTRGGGPTGPIPIFYPGGSPTAIPAGAPAAGAFPGTGLGGFFGNLFPPGAYPTSFLTGGTATGFVITGVYAWHSPFTAAGGAGGSSARVLVAAAAAPPSTPFVAVPTGGFATAFISAGFPGPTGIVGGPGAIPMPGLPIGTAFPAVFCGMAIGGPAFVTGWLGNGLGASLPPLPGNPPLRVGFYPPFFGTSGVLSAVPATPQNFIAGCFAAGATTPVELQSFSIE